MRETWTKTLQSTMLIFLIIPKDSYVTEQLT